MGEVERRGCNFQGTSGWHFGWEYGGERKRILSGGGREAVCVAAMHQDFWSLGRGEEDRCFQKLPWE